VLLADDEGIEHLEADVQQQLSAAAWTRFERAVTPRKLSVEYRVPL
jgi:hypothetical protein